MSERVGPTNNKCYICRKKLEQPARGRLRLTCSDACKQARYRSLKMMPSRRGNLIKKKIQKRRSVPFMERSFDTTFFEPVLELSYKRSVYECLACGKPFIMERFNTGGPQRYYCGHTCQFANALDQAHMMGRRIDPRVLERMDYQKLSPLCPCCRTPFAPNTTLHGERKTGRPRKYCSDRCRKEMYERRWKTQHRGRARVHRNRECAECRERFDRTDGVGRRTKRFCSLACTYRFHQRDYRVRQKRQSAGIKADGEMLEGWCKRLCGNKCAEFTVTKRQVFRRAQLRERGAQIGLRYKVHRLRG
jgi:hypothetical protein